MIISNKQLDQIRHYYNPIENQVFDGLLLIFGENLGITKNDFLKQSQLFFEKDVIKNSRYQDEDSFFSLLGAFLFGLDYLGRIPLFMRILENNDDYPLGQKLQIIIDTFHDLFYIKNDVSSFGSYLQNIYRLGSSKVRQEIEFFLEIASEDLLKKDIK